MACLTHAPALLGVKPKHSLGCVGFMEFVGLTEKSIGMQRMERISFWDSHQLQVWHIWCGWQELQKHNHNGHMLESSGNGISGTRQHGSIGIGDCRVVEVSHMQNHTSRCALCHCTYAAQGRLEGSTHLVIRVLVSFGDFMLCGFGDVLCSDTRVGIAVGRISPAVSRPVTPGWKE